MGFIGDFFRKLSGTKKCRNVQDLTRYIKRGDVFHLAHWISQRTWYKKDAQLSDEWQSADVAIANGACDCEEKAIIAATVINTWTPEYHSDVLVIANSSPGKAHAVAVFWGPKDMGIVDDCDVSRFPLSTPTPRVIFARWPTATYFYYADVHGKRISEKVYPK